MTELKQEPQQTKQNSLQNIVQSWKDQIICFSPQGSGYGAYFVDPRDSNPVNYIRASCDELRHLGTNYNAIFKRIKEQFYGYLKEAILNTVKYEATRRAVRKQHQWIQKSYNNLIAQKELNAEQQSLEIENLKQIIAEQNQSISIIKDDCPEDILAIQSENALRAKEAEIEAKNNEIARLNRQLQECDREITSLRSELSQGLQELKLKYKGLIGQFVQSSASKQQVDSQNKSLQACKNIFMKAQRKINSVQNEEGASSQQNLDLQGKVKMLRI
ncbi:MAG: hypothetical protein AAFO95_05490 [Cyanobacteria bacterium J06600_6]